MTEDALHESAIAGGANAFQNNMLGGSQDTPLNGDKEKAAEAKEPAMTADIELQGLALSSAITELGYALEAVSTLIFEIQVRAYFPCYAPVPQALVATCHAY